MNQVMRFRGMQGRTEREIELEGMVEELVWAMHLWGADEDNSIHPDAYATFREALKVGNIPHTEQHTQFDEIGYRFGAEYAQRMRVTWAMRNHKAE